MTNADYIKIVRECLDMLLVSMFCASTIHLTLKKKDDIKKCVGKWSAVISIALLVQFLSIVCISLFNNFVDYTITWEKVYANFLLEIGISSIYILYNVANILIPTAAALCGALWVYRQQKSIKIFTAVLIGLIATIIVEFVYGLAQLPFLGEDDGGGSRFEPPLVISIAILAVCFLLFYWLYRKKLNAKLKLILDTPDGRLDSFVKVPIFSVLVFVFLVAFLYTFGINPRATYWQNIFIWTVALGCLIFIYSLMYWSIFKGILLSTAAMKTRAELDVAKNIQASALPCTFPAFPTRKEFSIYASMTPAKEVGGDFYDFFFIDENHLAVVIADVSGKGVPAALFMMTARMLLKNLAATGRKPEEILTQANNQLCESNDARMFVTVWLGILDTGSGLLSFANAGHNPPLLRQENGEYRYLDHKTYQRSIMLGMRKNVIYKCNEIALAEKDVLFLYTDGVTEAENKSKELFGEARLKACMDGTDSSNPETLLASVTTALNDFVGDAEQFDDITMLGLRLDAIPLTYETPVGAAYTAEVSRFAEAFLEKSGCGTKIIHQVLIAVDEIFSNIVQYSGADKATLRCLAVGQELTLSFEDNGKAYNPLDAKEPDVNAPKSERPIGGLGIFMVKKTMDDIRYEYRDGQNILTIKKIGNEVMR